MSKFEFKMPRMGESISEATIINWLVNEGDTINEGDIIVEVATDKVDNEVPAPISGTLMKTLFHSNDVVPVGEVIAILEVSEDQNFKSDTLKTYEEKKLTSKVITKTPKSNTPSMVSHSMVSQRLSASNSNLFFSPLIISIAKEHHISFEELARIPASGDEGRLRKSDIFKYIEEGRPYKFSQSNVEDATTYRIPQLKFDKGKGKVIEMDRMRQMIADHMVYSKHTSPHVTAYVEADVTNLVEWRQHYKESFENKYGEKLTFTPLFVEAVAKAIQDFPNMNASVDGRNIIVKEDINIGMATALPNGNLIVPVVKNANKKDLKQLAEEVNSLSDKARNNKLKTDDIKGGSFTISNVGTFGSLMGTPIINQPEVAILAFGIIKKRPEVITTKKGDEIAIRSMMYLSLSFDHRAVDGFLGGSFLRRVADYLEQFDTKTEF
tara:strand:+ start:16279 stop:17589 length:1311 start_codon:yes stop_codon:yes gene_type:complete